MPAAEELWLWRVRAPEFTPKWLLRADKLREVIDVDASMLNVDDTEKWPPLKDRDGKPFELRKELAREDAKQAIYANAVEMLYSEQGRFLFDALDLLQLRHEGSPVWWTHLANGPTFAASLADLICGCVVDPVTYYTVGVTPKALAQSEMIRCRYDVAPVGDRVYLMSLAQWDNAEWPAESEDGPPFTPHVSVYR